MGLEPGFCSGVTVQRKGRGAVEEWAVCRRQRLVAVGLFGRDEGKDSEMEEAMRIQQEKLAMRKKIKEDQSVYYDEVQKRRTELEENYQKRLIKKTADDEDPLDQWKQLQEDGQIKDIGYDSVPEGGIQLPMASFGIPQYDNGERFDLRLPYVDTGYVDPDADVFSKLKKWFGGGKKEKETTEDSGKGQ